jgi:integrase
MSLNMLDLRSIKGIPTTEKAQWVVSVTSLPDGTPLVISRWGDFIWDWYPYIPQANVSPNQKRIDWRIALPDGRLLTDPEHANLLESTKNFLWSLFVDPVEGRKRPLFMTLCRKSMDIRPLLRWMVEQGLTRFEQLDGRTLDYVPVAKVREAGKSVAAHTAILRLQTVEDLYLQRHKLHDAPHSHPWPHESIGLLAGERQGGEYRKPKTDFIPDAVASRLCEVALDYVQNRSERLLATRTVVEIAAEGQATKGLGNASQHNAGTAAVRELGYDGRGQLNAELIRLRTACYIVIDMFSGARNSEITSLSDKCLAPGKSKDGSTDVLWLHGTIYKTGIRPHRWMVPPVVGEAVTVLSQLTAPLRLMLCAEEVEIEAQIGSAIAKQRAKLAKRLDSVRKQKTKLFLGHGKSGGGIAVLACGVMNVYLRQFSADFGILGDDNQPYPLHSHQFRRTYAHFVARSELGDLLVLRDHFGHWSIDMTTFYCDGGADEYEVDTELLEMVTEAKTVRQTEIMTGYLDSDTPLANGDHWLKGWRSSVRTAANKEALIAEYAGTITLNGTGHSWCVGNARGTGCGGLCVFEAKMCVDCNYGIIGQEHRIVWIGIRDQQSEALALDDMGPSGRARAQEIFEYAETVLNRLDGQEAA